MAVIDTYEINGGSVSSPSSSVYKYQIVTSLETQDDINNKSNISVQVYITALSATYTGTDGTALFKVGGIDVSKTSGIRSAKSVLNYNTKYLLAEHKGTFTHNDDGSLTINIEVNYGWSSGSGYLPKNITLTRSVTLPTISRQSQIISVVPANLISGGDLTISLERFVETYTDSVSIAVNGTTEKSWVKSSDLTFTATFAELTAHMATATMGTIVITTETFSGETKIGATNTYTLQISTGKMPLSIYHSSSGDYGVMIGRRCLQANVFEIAETMTATIPNLIAPNLIKILPFEPTIANVGASSYRTDTYSFTPDAGYTAIGVVGVGKGSGTDGGRVEPYRMEVDNNSLVVSLHNPVTSSQSVSLKFSILEVYTG